MAEKPTGNGRSKKSRAKLARDRLNRDALFERDVGRICKGLREVDGEMRDALLFLVAAVSALPEAERSQVRPGASLHLVSRTGSEGGSA